MKKMILAVCSLMLLLSLTACGYQVELKQSQGSESTQSRQEDSGFAVNDESQTEQEGSSLPQPSEDLENLLADLPVMSDDMRVYFDRYVPQGGLWAIPMDLDFDEENYFTINHVMVLFDYACTLGGEEALLHTGTVISDDKIEFPAEVVESRIQKYFLFDTASMRAGSEYGSATNTYRFGSGYGGGYYSPILVAVRQNGDLLELDLEQYGDTYTNGQGFALEFSNTLTLRLKEDGSWQYIANKVTYRHKA